MNFNPNKLVIGITQGCVGVVLLGVASNTQHFFIDSCGAIVLLVSALLSFKEVPKK